MLFGAFRPTAIAAFQPSGICSSGLLHKRPTFLNHTRKRGMRFRMKAVDDVIAAVAASGIECRAIEQAVALPKTHEMSPRDKYTTYNRRAKGYRKGVHLVPKWTRLSFRENPKGF